MQMNTDTSLWSAGRQEVGDYGGGSCLVGNCGLEW
jgi:hypothetical protein